MKYYGEDEEIEIPTLREGNDGEAIRVENIQDMELLVKGMGFDSIEDFNKECELPAEQLVGKWFTIMGKAKGMFPKQPVIIFDDADVSEAA